MQYNVNPYIKGEEEKCEREPLRILGTLKDGMIYEASRLRISAQCVRVPVPNGHLATISMSFANKPTREQIIEKWRSFKPKINKFSLPSSPNPFLTYFDQEDRPQTKLDCDLCNGMGIAIGRLQEDRVLDYKFVVLLNNIYRGAAGGAILLAELLVELGYIN